MNTPHDPEATRCTPGHEHPQCRGMVDPLRALSIIPPKMKSFEIDALLLTPSPFARVVDELMKKVRAEDERMRRILPEVPPGVEWRSEIQSLQRPDFDRSRGDITVRLIYRMVDTRTGEELGQWGNTALSE